MIVVYTTCIAEICALGFNCEACFVQMKTFLLDEVQMKICHILCSFFMKNNKVIVLFDV